MTTSAAPEAGATAGSSQTPSDAGQTPASGGGATGVESPTLESLAAQVRDLQAQNQQQQLTILELRNQPPARVEDEPEAPEPVDPLAELSDETLAGMSNRDLIKTAVTAVVKNLEATLVPRIQAQLGQVQDTVADQAARRDVAETATKHPDFWEYKNQMLVLSQQPAYRNLGAEDLYTLAKSKGGSSKAAPAAPKPAAPANPQEPQTLPRATGAPPQKTPAQQAADAAAASEKPGGSAAAGSVPKEFKNAEEAANDAYAKVFGNK